MRLAADPADGTGRDLPARPRQRLGDEVLAADAEAEHGLNEVSADLSEPDDRWCGRDRGPCRSGLGVSPPLPVRDRVRTDPEGLGCGLRVPAKEALDLEDPETLGWRVVGPVAVGDLVEAGAQEVDYVEGQLGGEFRFLEASQGSRERILEAAEVSKQTTRGKAEEMRGAQGRPMGQPLRGPVDFATQPHVKGWGGVEQGSLHSEPRRRRAVELEIVMAKAARTVYAQITRHAR